MIKGWLVTVALVSSACAAGPPTLHPSTGAFDVQAQAFGYDKQIRRVQVGAGPVDTLVFRLKWNPPRDVEPDTAGH